MKPSAEKMLEQHQIEIIYLPDLFKYFDTLYSSSFPLMHNHSNSSSILANIIEEPEITYRAELVEAQVPSLHSTETSPTIAPPGRSAS